MPTRAPSYRPSHAAAFTAISRRDHDRTRGSASERGYGWRWQQYTRGFLADNYACACGCQMPATLVDHIVPINGPEDDLFWDERNHQALTRDCHNRKTKRADDLLRALRLGASTAKWPAEDVANWRELLKSRNLIT